VSQKRANFGSCIFDKHGLILIILANSISTLSKMLYLCKFSCPSLSKMMRLSAYSIFISPFPLLILFAFK